MFGTGTLRGAVKFYNVDKRFGFVSTDEEDVHIGGEVGDKFGARLAIGIVVDVVYITTSKGKTASSITIPRYRGQVRWFNSDKGFGFITCPEIGPTIDIYLHVSKMRSPGLTVTDGSTIEFCLTEGLDGRFSAYDAALMLEAQAA